MSEHLSEQGTHEPVAPQTRWARATGGEAGEDYARRMAQASADAEAAGRDAHGEARFVHALAERALDRPTARVLDAGCGTGRVAIALHAMGHPVMGIDADLSMLRVAAEVAPKIPFWLSDLAELDVPQAAIAGGFDVVVLAGNVVPYLADGTLPAVLAELARVTRRGGLVVAGFGIHPTDLPAGLPVVGVAEYDAAAAAAGLEPAERYAGWGREPFANDATYAVSVHRLVTPPPPRDAADQAGSSDDAGMLPAGRITRPREPLIAGDGSDQPSRGGLRGLRGLFGRR